MEKKYFYKSQWKLTVKEINEYADSIEDKAEIECKVAEWLDTFKCMMNCHAFDSTKYSEDFPYAVELAISEKNGHVIANAYDYDKYKKWQEDCAKVWLKWEQDKDSDEQMPDITEDFAFELPVTRGFSDCPDRCDVAITSDNDITMAIDEYIAEKENKRKVYPWMIKQMMPAEGLGMDEDELDTILEDMFA